MLFNIQKAIAVFIVLFLALSVSAQLQPYNKAVVWRGFEHYFSYNHRCNRIGDFVQKVNDSTITTHCSATGTGNDSTNFTSYYSSVSTPDAVFYTGADTILIEGVKDSLIVTKDTIEITCPAWLLDKTEYVTLLNGFDLRNTGQEAQKIQVLYLTVGDAVYMPEIQKLRFIIKSGMVLNCKTAECKLCNHEVHYKLTAYYLIAGLDKHESAATTQLFTSSYSWNKKNALKEPPLRDYIKGSDYPDYKKAVVGIKSFNLLMDKDHWLLQWSNSLQPGGYDIPSASLQVDVDQLFKEWRPGMERSHISPLDSKFSVKQKGWEVLNIDAVMLQFKKGQVTDSFISNQMYWPGKGKVPDSSTGPDISRSASSFE